MDILKKIRDVTRYSKYYQGDKYIHTTSFNDLPIINKYEVIKNYAHIFNSKPPIIYTQTSGSNGTPLRIAWNYNDYLKSLASLWRLRYKYGITPMDFQLTCHAEFDIHGNRIDNPILILPNSLSLSKICYSNDILCEYIKYIDLFKPKWIYAQPSFIYYIGKYIFENKPELVKNIKYVELVGELLMPEIQEQIAGIFTDATVINMYGMQEFNCIMYEEEGLMRIIKDNVYVEILDDNGNNCDIGEEGNIVVTGLINSVFPLIRYNTGDRGKKLNKNGVEGYIITAGRSNDAFEINGNLYDGAVFFNIINEYNKKHRPNILRFQVIYAENKFTFFLWSNLILPNENIIANDLRNIIIDIIHISLPLEVKIVYSYENFMKGGNKIKYFINSEYGF